jgi:hypothetical protein
MDIQHTSLILRCGTATYNKLIKKGGMYGGTELGMHQASNMQRKELLFLRSYNKMAVVGS